MLAIEAEVHHDVIAFLSHAGRVGRRRRAPPARRAHLVGPRRHRARAARSRRRAACWSRGARAAAARRVDAGASAIGDTPMVGRTPRHPRRADHVRAQVPAVERGAGARPRPAVGRARGLRGGQVLAARSARSRTSSPELEAAALGALRLDARAGGEPGGAARPARRAAVRRSRWPAGRWRRSRSRSATCSAARCARRRSRSARRRRAPRRCRTSATRCAASACADWRACCAAYALAGAREPGAVARARHQPLVGRARDPAGCVPDAGLHGRTTCAGCSSGLRVRPGARCARNLDAGGGLVFSQRVLLALTAGGHGARRGVPDRAAATRWRRSTAARRSAPRSRRTRESWREAARRRSSPRASSWHRLPAHVDAISLAHRAGEEPLNDGT